MSPNDHDENSKDDLRADTLAVIKGALSKGKSKAPPAPVAAVPEQRVYCPRTGMPILLSVLQARQAANRARNTPYQRDRRARKRAEERAIKAARPVDPAESRAAPEPKPVDLAARTAARSALFAWFEIDGRRQKLMRPRRQTYLLGQLLLLESRRVYGDDPIPAEFARRFNKEFANRAEPITPNSALHLIKKLRELEAECGPWCP